MRAFLFLPISLALVGTYVSAAEPLEYNRDIRPILSENCFTCHGPDKTARKAGLRLDLRDDAVKAEAIVPGKPQESLLVERICSTDAKEVMPPPKSNKKLTQPQKDILRRWISEGAEYQPHWSFIAPNRPGLPAVKNEAWVRNPIDRFILARLDKEKVAPSPEADRITLIRRLNLDLLGLPPSRAEVEEFIKDQRPDAYEHLVDRLLNSPHYGERWGRHWLDQARYADSNGFTIDGPRSIWTYRDWVINALNRDMPFDQFAIQQIAGDLLPNATTEDRVATGFHRNTLRNEEGGIDQEQFRVESVVDRVNTTGSVFLGLTVGCCQCHDHKFDPISTREYYQLFAFLNNADEPSLDLATAEQARERDRVRKRIAELEKQRKLLDSTTAEAEMAWEIALTDAVKEHFPTEIREILRLPENGRSAKQKLTLTGFYRKIDQTRHMVGGVGNPLPFLTAAHAGALVFRTTVDQQLLDLKKSEPAVTTTLVLQERATPRMTAIHIQGDFTRKGAQVGPGTPSVLHPLPSKEKLNRLDLANWLVDPANPLTARVIVNRFWQAYFGLGLVETDNDFGTQGTPPSHPELLDWLATEFIRQNWSMKEMHRQIVTSATYRQSSRHRPELATLDARNRLLARQNRIRLEAEVVRDVALAASGLLNPKIGGPSVFPPQPDGVYAFTQVNKNWKPSTGPDRFRRGLYTYFWRSAPHPGLTVFDAPDANSTCTRRNRSNTPLQALTLLNDQAYYEFAVSLAGRVLKEAPPSDAHRVRYAFEACLARPPKEMEQKRLESLLAQQLASFAASPEEARQLLPADVAKDADVKQLAAWTMLSRVLLNLDEFITRE